MRADTPLATVRRLCDLIPGRFEYRAGVTYVGTTVEEFLTEGAGVCQDYVHLGLLLLRRNGIGVYQGGAVSTLDVSVQMTRLEGEASTPG